MVLLILLTAVVSLSADESLSRDEQVEIIENYLYATGRTTDRPATALGEYDHGVGNLPVKCGTPAVLEFLAAYRKLDQGLLKSLGAELYNRPTGLDQSHDSDSGLFRVHYTTSGLNAVYGSQSVNENGVPNFVVKVAEILDSVYAFIVDSLEYPPPPPDGYEPGGDEKYDVYLRNLFTQVYGYAYPDSLLREGNDSLRSTSFIELNSNPSQLFGYENRPLDAVRVTCAHEFFHAVQFGMDATEERARDLPSRAFMEMSAVWMEEMVFDNINDYYYYLPYFFRFPQSSIMQFTSTHWDYHPYGSVVFPIYLAERFGHDIIRDIWMRCRDLGFGPDFLEAADQAIYSASGQTENWETAFSEFALWNYFTGERTDSIPDGVTGYSEKEFYPAVPYEKIDVQFSYPVIVDINDNIDNSPDHNGAYYLKLHDLEYAAEVTEITYWVCTTGAGAFPNCTDSFQVADTMNWLGFFDSFTYHVDSSFNIWLSLGKVGDVIPPLRAGWGAHILYRTLDNPDSLILDFYMFDDDYTSQLKLLDHRQYLSVTFILTPASPERFYWNNPMYHTMKLGYKVGGSSFDSSMINVPAAVLAPYPNPVRVGEAGHTHVRFKLRVPTDTSSFPTLGRPFTEEDPHLEIDIFTIAGERVKTLDNITWRVARMGEYYTEWDLTNESGAEVAAGVYIAHARLYSKARRGYLVAQDRAKVAVIR